MQLEGDVLTFIASAHGATPQTIDGSISGIRRALGLGYLTEVTLEDAIARTEELIMPIIRCLPEGAQFEIQGAELAGVYHVLSEDKGIAVPLDSVEQLFNQLADYASRVPAAWQQPAPAEQLALGLVVLREVMHHGGFSVVSLSRRTQ